MKRLLLALFLLAATALAEPAQYTYRVTGLFDRQREPELREFLQALPDIQLVSLDFDHAEAVFAFDPAVAFKGTKPENLRTAFSQKLRALSRSTFALEPPSTVPHDQLTRLEIGLEVLDCRACALAVQEAVAPLPGVVQATVSPHEGRLVALVEPGPTTRETLEKALVAKKVKVVPIPP